MPDGNTTGAPALGVLCDALFGEASDLAQMVAVETVQGINGALATQYNIPRNDPWR